MEDKYFVEDVIITQDSGYVVSGSFELCDEFFYEHWGFLMKTDKDGNMLWASKDSVDFMSDNGDFVDFVETSDGDFITIGSRIPSGGYMMKRDNEGNRLWEIPYTSFGTKSMSNTADNNIILGGVVNSNIALRKIDNNGNTIWTKSYNCGNVAIANSIKETSDGDYILTGYLSGNGYDIIVMKTDSFGDSLWKRTFDGYGYNDMGNCVIETNGGNILIVGKVGLPYPIYNYGFSFKIDSNGDTLWTKIFDDGLLYWIGSVVQTQDNNYLLQGGKLVKMDENQNIIWEEPLIGQVFGGGDRNLQEISGGGFICTSVINWGDYIVINKTDSLGQVFSIDDPSSPNNNISINIFPNPILDNCKIVFNKYNISLKDPCIKIYNIKGQMIRELEIENNELGIHEIIWDGTAFNGEEVQNGIYFLKLESDKYRAVKKVTKIE